MKGPGGGGKAVYPGWRGRATGSRLVGDYPNSAGTSPSDRLRRRPTSTNIGPPTRKEEVLSVADVIQDFLARCGSKLQGLFADGGGPPMQPRERGSVLAGPRIYARFLHAPLGLPPHCNARGLFAAGRGGSRRKWGREVSGFGAENRLDSGSLLPFGGQLRTRPVAGWTDEKKPRRCSRTNSICLFARKQGAPESQKGSLCGRKITRASSKRLTAAGFICGREDGRRNIGCHGGVSQPLWASAMPNYYGTTSGRPLNSGPPARKSGNRRGAEAWATTTDSGR